MQPVHLGRRSPEHAARGGVGFIGDAVGRREQDAFEAVVEHRSQARFAGAQGLGRALFRGDVVEEDREPARRRRGAERDPAPGERAEEVELHRSIAGRGEAELPLHLAAHERWERRPDARSEEILRARRRDLAEVRLGGLVEIPEPPGGVEGHKAVMHVVEEGLRGPRGPLVHLARRLVVRHLDLLRGGHPRMAPPDWWFFPGRERRRRRLTPRARRRSCRSSRPSSRTARAPARSRPALDPRRRSRCPPACRARSYRPWRSIPAALQH